MEQLKYPRSYKIAVLGGGHGPLVLEDELLNITPFVDSHVSVHDDGGYAGLLKSKGIRSASDGLKRLQVHVRDLDIRMLLEKFTYEPNGRRHEDDSDHPLKDCIKRQPVQPEVVMLGRRPANDMLALAEHHQGDSLIRGMKLLEKTFRADYVGRVIPVTDDRVDLILRLTNGEYVLGESNIDLMKPNDTPIAEVDFYPRLPKVNPESETSIEQADAIVIAPGTFFGSIDPLCQLLASAIKKSKAKVFWYANAFSKPETHRWTAKSFAEHLAKHGIWPDYALINKITHRIPRAYAEEESYPIVNDLVEGLHAGKVIEQAMTTLAREEVVTAMGAKEWRDVVRHCGDEAAKPLIITLDQIYSTDPALVPHLVAV